MLRDKFVLRIDLVKFVKWINGWLLRTSLVVESGILPLQLSSLLTAVSNYLRGSSDLSEQCPMVPHYRLHLVELSPEHLLLILLILKVLPVELHVQLLQFRIQHVRWNIGDVLLHLFNLLPAESGCYWQVCQFEELYDLQLVVSPLYSLAFLDYRPLQALAALFALR